MPDRTDDQLPQGAPKYRGGSDIDSLAGSGIGPLLPAHSAGPSRQHNLFAAGGRVASAQLSFDSLFEETSHDNRGTGQRGNGEGGNDERGNGVRADASLRGEGDGHMQTYLPVRYSQIDDPDELFPFAGRPDRRGGAGDLRSSARDDPAARRRLPGPGGDIEQPEDASGRGGVGGTGVPRGEAPELGSERRQPERRERRGPGRLGPRDAGGQPGAEHDRPGVAGPLPGLRPGPQTGVARWAQAEPENWNKYCARFGVDPETGEPSGKAPSLLSTSTPPTRTNHNDRSDQIRGSRRGPTG